MIYVTNLYPRIAQLVSLICNSFHQFTQLILSGCNVFPQLTSLVPSDSIPSRDLHNLFSRIAMCSLGLHYAVRVNEFCKSKERIPYRI